MSNYAKDWRKNATGAYISNFSKKADLFILKSEVDKVYVDELETVPVHFKKLCDEIIKRDVLKKSA